MVEGTLDLVKKQVERYMCFKNDTASDNLAENPRQVRDEVV